MIIFTDEAANIFGGIAPSPAITHVSRDFASILDEIARGNIPCGTGQPFDVNYKAPNPNANPWPPQEQNPFAQTQVIGQHMT